MTGRAGWRRVHPGVWVVAALVLIIPMGKLWFDIEAPRSVMDDHVADASPSEASAMPATSPQGRDAQTAGTIRTAEIVMESVDPEKHERTARRELAEAEAAYADATQRVRRHSADYLKPLYVISGTPLCPTETELEAEASGAPSRCARAPQAMPVYIMSGQGNAFLGRMVVRFGDDATFASAWVHAVALTNDPVAFETAIQAQSAAHRRVEAAKATLR